MFQFGTVLRLCCSPSVCLKGHFFHMKLFEVTGFLHQRAAPLLIVLFSSLLHGGCCLWLRAQSVQTNTLVKQCESHLTDSFICPASKALSLPGLCNSLVMWHSWCENPQLKEYSNFPLNCFCHTFKSRRFLRIQT